MRRWENWISYFLTFAGTLNFRDSSREFHFRASFPQLSRSRFFCFMPKVTQNSFRQNLYSPCMYMPLFDAAQLCETRICKFLPASLRSVAKLGGTGASSTGSKIKWAAASEQAGLSKERNAQDIPRLKQYEAINANPPFRIEQNHSLHFFALSCNLCHNLCLNRTRSLHREPLHHPLPRLCSFRRLWPKEVVQWLLTMSQLPPGCHTVSQFHEILSLTSFSIWRWAIQRSPFKISLKIQELHDQRCVAFIYTSWW